MHKVTLILLLLMTSFSLAAQNDTFAQAVGKQRVVLVFAPAEDDPHFKEQRTEMRHHLRECSDYDLLLVSAALHAGPSRPPADPLSGSLSGDEQAAARRRFHILPDEFTVLLLGKDGGEKLRSKDVLTLSTIAAAIDAMPMRQQEVEHRRTRPRR